MLPSTGHFMNISCPFYETCLCERPYCHFKHTKREPVGGTNLISELVSEAVDIILNSNVNKKSSAVSNYTVGANKHVTYNPTPISELEKIKSNTTTKQLSEEQNWFMQSSITTSKFPNYSTNKSTASSPLYTTNFFNYASSITESEDSLSLNNIPFYKEYVPENTDKFINNPSICESTEIKTDESNKIDEKIESSEKLEIKNTNESKKHSKIDTTKSNHKKIDKDSKSSSKSSKHKTEKKDQVHKQEKECKYKDKKHKNRKECSKSRSRKKSRERNRSKSRETKDKHEKSVHYIDKICINNKKSTENVSVTNSDVKVSEDEFSHLVSSDFLEEISSSDDDLEQCKQIFDEYQPPIENIKVETCTKSTIRENETFSNGKKRVAHENSQKNSRKTITKATTVKSAAQVMADRYKQVRTSVDEINATEQLFERKLNKVTETNLCHCPAKKTRIAYVPNVNSLLNAKKKVEEFAQTKHISKTPIQTISKGAKRIAHVPEVIIADIPTVLHSDKSKLPVNVRNRYLFLMIKECVKLYFNKQAAYERALNEELNCYSKCSTIATYKNSIMLSINRLRKEADLDLISSNQPSVENNDFCGLNFYNNIIKWILTDEQLLENGFPRTGSTKKGFALFKEIKFTEKVPEGHELCARCHKLYKINEKGFQIYKEDCLYHPEKRFSIRGETTYLCCKDSITNTGCCIASNHVFEIRDPHNLSGFVTTLEPDNLDDSRCYAVYALDCEMVYTSKGIELGRVTVINSVCEVVYESLVKPMGVIIDCNTRYSGITADMLENITTKITDVQAALLVMFNSKTILIGHSLESDLKALRLIHNTIIDTSVLFPHKLGPPKKRGLRSLASDFLKKIIQNNESGHDSAEDAVTCMELIIWKLKEEIKLR